MKNLKETLKQAQDRYGYANQITVTTEELCELAAVLSKYPRFPTHELASAKIREKVVEEMADVLICLGHVEMIFDIKPSEVEEVIQAKLARMQRWLATDKGFHQTTVDRDWK